MLWSIILPFKITFYLLLISVILITTFKPFVKWSRKKTFFISFSLSILLFIPSCTGVQIVIDKYRFGKFQYQKYSDIQDEKINYSLPKKAKDITLYKFDNCHYAKYKISKTDLILYINNLWNKQKEFSTFKRTEIEGEGQIIDKENLKYQFKNTDYVINTSAIQFYGPIRSNGAGSIYYYVPTKSIVYQQTGYW